MTVRKDILTGFALNLSMHFSEILEIISDAVPKLSQLESITMILVVFVTDL